MNVVADTHAWVWFLTANPRLSIKAKAALSHPENLIIIPTIVILEIKFLCHRKRIALSYEEAVRQIESGANVLLYPLDLSIASLAPVSLEIHDAIIVGTTLHLSEELGHPVSLVTADQAIVDSGLVPVIW